MPKFGVTSACFDWDTAILYFPVAHNALCLPPPPPPQKETIVVKFSWEVCIFPRAFYNNSLCKIWGANRVHYGKLENREFKNFVINHEMYGHLRTLCSDSVQMAIHLPTCLCKFLHFQMAFSCLWSIVASPIIYRPRPSPLSTALVLSGLKSGNSLTSLPCPESPARPLLKYVMINQEPQSGTPPPIMAPGLPSEDGTQGNHGKKRRHSSLDPRSAQHLLLTPTLPIALYAEKNIRKTCGGRRQGYSRTRTYF